MVQREVARMSTRECEQRSMRNEQSMDEKSTPVLRSRDRPKPGNELRQLVAFLQAQNELLDDKAALRKLGLTEEEIQGYEEFFAENFFISPLWGIKNGSNV